MALSAPVLTLVAGTPRMARALTVRHRLMLVNALYLLPILALLWAYVGDKAAWIAFVERERAGLAVLRVLSVDLTDDPAAALAARARLDPSAPFADRALAALEGISRADGDPRSRRAAMMTVIETIADASGLILDPELASYYVLDVYANQLASLTMRLAALRDLIAQSPREGAPSAAIAIRLSLERQSVADLVDQTARSLSKVRGTGLPPDLDRLLGQRASALTQSQVVLDAAVARLEREGGDGTVATAALAQMARDRQALDQAAGDGIEVLLRARRDRLMREGGLSLILGLGCAALAYVGARVLGRRILRPLAEIDGVLRKAEASGDYGARVQWTSGDELGRVAQSLNRLFASETERDKLAREEARLRETLLERDAQYREFVDAAQVGIVIVDYETGVVTAAGAIHRILAMPPDHRLSAGDLFKRVHPEDRAAMAERVARLTQSTAMDFEVRMERFDGVLVWMSILARVTIRDGRVTRIVSGYADITDRIRAELAVAAAREQEAATSAAAAAKDSFFAHMTHELRTPINAIVNYASLVREEMEDTGDIDRARIAQDLERIGRAADHLRGLVDQVLDLSKIAAGHLELDPAPVSVPDLLDELGALGSALAARKGLAFHVETDPAVTVIVQDPMRLRQILLNLISNAIKFTETGRVDVVVAAEPDEIRFMVTDTGIGMAPETIAKLFRDYVQADRGIAGRFGGTGLGLALSRKLARLMGGDIHVDSALGAGSRFSLIIPLRRPPDDGEAPSATAA